MLKKFFTYRKRQQSREITLSFVRCGSMLLLFNILLSLCYLFGLLTLSSIYKDFYVPLFYDAFLPLIVLFIFSGASAIVWFRFGQLLGKRFSSFRFAAVAFTSIISIVGLLIVLTITLFLADIVTVFNSLFSLLALSFFTMSLLAILFQVIVLLLGSVNRPTS